MGGAHEVWPRKQQEEAWITRIQEVDWSFFYSFETVSAALPAINAVHAAQDANLSFGRYYPWEIMLAEEQGKKMV